MSTHKAGRQNAPTIMAIVAGEPVTIAAGDRVTIAYSGGGGGRRGGFRGAGATHTTEAAATRRTRDEAHAGTFVAAITADHVGTDGRRYGPAVRIDGGLVHEGNVHGVRHADGSPAYRFARDDRGRPIAPTAKTPAGAASDDGERVHVLDTAGRRTVVGRWLPLYRANGEPSSQLVSVDSAY